MTTALIDGDIVAFRSAASCQSDIDWGDGFDGPTVNFAAAVEKAKGMVRDWTTLARCKDALLCFSPVDGVNFRRDLTTYKAHRTGAKPKVYWSVIEALTEEWPIRRMPRLEADDVVGILHTSEVTDTVAVSIDKDFLTLPGLLLNPVKDTKPKRVTKQAANEFWMTQTLIGDSCDGYKGCPGVGPVRVAKTLPRGEPLDVLWEYVKGLFESKGLTEDDAILQARLARILRREDYDKENEEIWLWHPREPVKLRLIP